MQELTGVKSNSGEQNKDMSKARQKRAALDTLVILTNIADRDPFSADPNLRNIMTGVNADNAVKFLSCYSCWREDIVLDDREISERLHVQA